MDERPLFLNQGPLTNLASALLIEPSIALTMTAVWIGGGPYPGGGYEFNLGNDIAAASAVMRSQVRMWQIPVNVYSLMKASLATLADRVAPHGASANICSVRPWR
jgi:inosine-uridine nucleoside N-ribohydrolase